MGSPAFIPTFSMADFAQAIAAPYSSFRAYQSGVIDSQGNLIKPESSIDPFEYFVIKMKKIFDEIPPTITKSRLSSYNSAFQLFSEEAKAFGIPFDQFVFFVEGYLTSKFLLTEDMGAGAAGGGMATGTSPGDLGVPQEYKSVGQVSGYDKPLPSPMFQRGPVEMFDLEQNEFDTFKGAKGWKNLPDSATKRYLQRFQRRNPSGRMGIRTKRDNGESDLYWITYPAKNFMEQFGLENLDFLFEETDKEELESTGKKTMVSLTARSKKEISDKEAENASVLFGGMLVGGNNVEKEKALLGAITKRLESAGYKLKPGVKSKKELGIGEFGIFGEGGQETHSDIHVGMEHPEKKGTVHQVGIESGYNERMQKQYLIPKGTRIPLSKGLKTIGLEPTSSNITSREGEIDVGEELIKRGSISGKKKRFSLWPTIEKLFPGKQSRIKELLKKPAQQAIQTKSDDISIIGHGGRIAAVHHRNMDSVERKLGQQLMDQMNLHHTHNIDELTFSRSPFYGGSKNKKVK